MSAPVTEIFTGGIVTARHPAQLQPGELQRADDCIYRDNDAAIKRAPGRIQLTSAAIGTAIRGMGNLSFDSAYVDQFVALGLATSGTPTWYAGPDITYPGTHLYSAVTSTPSANGYTLAEMGGVGRWYGVVSGTSFTTQVAIASCTISASTNVAAASNAFLNVPVGAVVSGTGITAGTRVQSVDSDTQLTLDTAATSGTVTLTFTQYPFLSTAVGSPVIGTSVGSNVYVSAVSNQDGTTGHYRTVTLTNAPSGSDANYYLTFPFGTAYNFSNSGNEILDFVQYGNRKYYLMDGVGLMRCAEWKTRAYSGDATLGAVLALRNVGLKPVIAAPTLTQQTGQSTGWNTVKGAGTYWILITEIFSPNNDVAAALKDPDTRAQVIESAYLAGDNTTTNDNGSQSGVGLPLPVSITTPATDNILVTFPAVANDGTDGYLATHWGIYIYGPVSDMPSLASLRRCATVPITTFASGATYTLTDVTLTQTKFPTAIAASAVTATQFGHNDRFISSASFDGQMAYTKVGGSGKHIPDNAAQKLLTYGHSVTGSYLAKTVFGIELQVGGQANPSGDTTGGARFWVRLSSGSKVSDMFYGEFGSTYTIRRVGGPMDTLGVSWALSDTTGMFVDIGIANRGSKDELDIDTVAIKIYYTSNKVDFNGPAYRVVTYRNQVGETVSDPARLLPPPCSTSDFFKGMFVSNDLTRENRIKYSLPGEPEASPKPYFLEFNTRKKDTVTYVRTLGPILFCGMANSLKRVNYLPTEQDTDMNSGLAHEDIASDHGIPGSACAVKFDMPGVGEMIAYASLAGPYLTNGIWTRPLNTDLAWSSLVKLSALSTAIMRVYPSQKLIALYYCPAAATHNKNTRVIYFSYQADKLKSGNLGPELPAVGPIIVSARAASAMWYGGTPYLITANENDGFLYLEDSGLSIPSNYRVRLNDDSANGDGKTTASVDVSINPLIRTRRIYPAGMEQDAYGENLYVLFSSYGARTVTAVATPVSGSTTVTSSAAFGSVVAGMLVSGTGIDGGTIVLSKSDSSTIVLSRAANTDAAAGTTLTFDTGTIAITVRSNGVIEAPVGRQTVYGTTSVGDLLALIAPEIGQGFELQFEKVPLTFDSNHDTLTWADLGVDMRLHQFTYVMKSAGRETNRATR